MKKKKEEIVLIGSGNMAKEYAKVLQDLHTPLLVIGRGQKSADIFSQYTGIPVASGGFEEYSKENQIPKKAIVAVDGDQLGQVAITLLNNNVQSILLEKPGGIDFVEITKVAQVAKERNSNVFIAYNRRFYASVQKAQEIINKDGGVLSYFFEFTEWPSVIEKLQTSKKIKENWFLHNSTHVVDLAFFLGGYPKEMVSYTSSSFSWHTKAAIFSGAGITDRGALFSYHANWRGPGRWGIELVTKNHRLILRPLEKLQIQKSGNIDIEYAEIDDKLDLQYKHGLYRQVEAFLNDNKQRLCSIVDQQRACKIYKKILEG